jgi:hypothetical protein
MPADYLWFLYLAGNASARTGSHFFKESGLEFDAPTPQFPMPMMPLDEGGDLSGYLIMLCSRCLILHMVIIVKGGSSTGTARTAPSKTLRAISSR